MGKTQLDEYVAKDLEKQKGVSIPVHAGLLERLLVRKTACSNLHPNAEDEFSMPSVGPSYRIISEYETKFREALHMDRDPFDDPLMVEKLRPHGYLLLNGHHRWAAAMRCQIKRVPIKIINCATESDIKTIIEKSQHDKRTTIDLDEVIFCAADGPAADKSLPLPLKRMQNASIRLGIPALLYELGGHGFDIWIYTSQYYSLELQCQRGRFQWR